MKTTTVDGVLTKGLVTKLARAGLVGEQRGGDPLRSVDRDPRARRTRLVVRVRRLDGGALTGADRRVIKKA